MGASSSDRSTRPDRYGDRREATPDEYRAMANPLRMRIIRICLYEGHTNKEIADALGIEPASCLHHVRMLVKTGFLERMDSRPGPRGSTEKPYRSTGKSWILEAPTDESDYGESWLAGLDAVRQEMVEGGPEAQRSMARVGLKMSGRRANELAERLEKLIYEYAEADPDEDGDHYGLYIVFHELGRKRRARN